VNPFPFRDSAVCYVCGETGDCNARAVWSANARHIHPEVCAANLAAQRRRAERAAATPIPTDEDCVL
jgi:hypothetical protein